MFNEKVTVVRAPTVIEPTDVCAYFDLVQFWLPGPLPTTTVAQLEAWCGSVHHPDHCEPARFDARLRQRVELKQPSVAALSWLSEKPDALVNRIELALDLTFNNRASLDDAGDHLHRYLVRRWHGTKQKVRFTNKSRELLAPGHELTMQRIDAGRWSPNQISLYKQDHSRITGQLDCLHLEWRLNRLKAVRAAGIATGRDLVNYDHRAFWKKHLRLYDVDRRRLGRLIRNRAGGKRSRTSAILRNGHYRVHLDGRTGEVLARSFYTVQELIDHVKARYRVRVHRALIPISTEDLLPERGGVWPDVFL